MKTYVRSNQKKNQRHYYLSKTLNKYKVGKRRRKQVKLMKNIEFVKNSVSLTGQTENTKINKSESSVINTYQVHVIID